VASRLKMAEDIYVLAFSDFSKIKKCSDVMEKVFEEEM